MATLEELVHGELWGATLLEGRVVAVQRVQETDARRRALVALRQYLSLITFARSSGQPATPPTLFRIPITSIQLEQPDDPQELRFPAVAVIPGPGTHEPIGMGPPFLIEETFGVFAPGTALVHVGEYTERLELELWASHRAERRALVVGLEQAFRPLQDSYSLRLRLPNYFGCIAEFTLLQSRYIDEPDVIKGRRRAQLTVELRVAEVILVRVEAGQALVTVLTVDTGDC